jgi:hypothetical protein
MEEGITENAKRRSEDICRHKRITEDEKKKGYRGWEEEDNRG